MRILLSLLLVAAFALPADAHHCATWSTTTSTRADTNPMELDGVPRYYVDSNPNVFHEGILGESWWIYEETNGIPGLQRGDEEIDDTCHGMIAPDTVTF